MKRKRYLFLFVILQIFISCYYFVVCPWTSNCPLVTIKNMLVKINSTLKSGVNFHQHTLSDTTKFSDLPFEYDFLLILSLSGRKSSTGFA
jgi:hypothetical protein